MKNSMKKSAWVKTITIGMITLLIIALVVVFQLKASDQAGQQSGLGMPINDQIGGDFILPSTTGVPVDLQQLRGKVILMTFGYANCTEICPLGLMRLHEVIEASSANKANLSVLFISFDSEKDMSGLAKYVKHFNPAIVGLSGSSTEIDNIATQYGVVYPKKSSITGQASFDHNGYIYLLDQQGRVRAMYQNRTLAKEIIKDIHLLQKE